MIRRVRTILLMVLLVGGGTRIMAQTDGAGNTMRTAVELAAQMAPGWNLGNTMEGGDGRPIGRNVGLATETAWQPTPVSRELFALVRQLGFRSVRIPCNWMNGHIADPDSLTIDTAWMARVRQIVDWCLAEDLYVVLNDHWDGGWLEDEGFAPDADVETLKAQLRRIWTQIATEFRDYGDRLLLAGLNEPFHNRGTDSAKVARLVAYEQVFVDAVRATGGNNARRALIVQGPETNIGQTVKLYPDLPTDPAGEGRMMMEVHYYDPWQFCGLERDESWGTIFYYYNRDNYLAGSTRCATWGDNGHAASQMRLLRDRFTSRGIPVIIGEYGCIWREVGEGESQALHDASVRAFHRDVVSACMDNGCVPFLWDQNDPGATTCQGMFTLIGRDSLRVLCQPALDGIREGLKPKQ